MNVAHPGRGLSFCVEIRFMIQKFFAAINFFIGGLGTAGAILGFVALVTTTSSRGMALLVVFLWVVLGAMTLPLLGHGYLFFNRPDLFERFSTPLLILMILEVFLVYFKTRGFYQVCYHNEPYQLKEFLVFCSIVSYFAIQLLLYPGPVGRLLRNLLGHAPV